MAKRKLSSIIRELDEVLKIVTGRDIPTLSRQAWEELRRPRAEPSAADPYQVLGLDRNCIPSDVVSRYRELAKKFHPDGTQPDVERFKKITEAYEEVCRRWAKP